MEAALHPLSTMTERVRETSIAGGVVIMAGATSEPSSIWTVPIMPVRMVLAFMMRQTRCAMVVLPLVPVTPMMEREREGSP